MAAVSELIPELAQWNDGRGIAPDEWVFENGRADHALALCALLWPEFVELDGYVLRGPLEEERLRGWERAGHTRQQIETAMNAFLLEGIFPEGLADEDLKEKPRERFATIMTEILSAKLARDFPGCHFSAFVMEGEDFGVSFHQI